MKRLVLLLPLLTGCGGGSSSPSPPPEDSAWANQARAGRIALEAERPVDAARLYGAAVARARLRDDAEAIADAGIGLVAAELDTGDAAGALRTALDVQAELSRRGAAVPASLHLAMALAQYRLGRIAAADATAIQAIAGAAGDHEVAQRAWFLRGPMAADRGDVSTLASARAAVGEPSERGFRADAVELSARQALTDGDVLSAQRLAQEALVLRRETLDYRGLARLLVIQAELARRQGDIAAAADLMLRAGRGAATRRDLDVARRWLGQAEALARHAGAADVVEAARSARHGLDRTP